MAPILSSRLFNVLGLHRFDEQELKAAFEAKAHGPDGVLTRDDVRALLTEVLSNPAGPRALAGSSSGMPTSEEVSQATDAFMQEFDDDSNGEVSLQAVG